MVERILFLVFCLTFVAPRLSAQQDTAKIHLLNEVEVKASAQESSFKASSPVQVLKVGDLAIINALQISDAVKFFAGAQVKDYGGVGGLKTVSIRSLGAGYTNVAYDGIPIPDYQTGQTDLGRFTLENVEMIAFHIGESDQIFQTAKIQSLAGALNVITQSLPTEGEKKQKLKASLKAGSFGFINPSVWYGQVLNKTFSANVSADYLKSDGDYPFKQTIGHTGGGIDLKKRNNSDVDKWNVEMNLAGNFANEGKLSFKTLYYGARRGLPGPAFYYVDTPAGERLNDRNFATQIHYTQAAGKKFNFQTNAKFDFAFTDYTNPEQNLKSLFYQRGFYLNATFLYKPSEQLSFSWANDGDYGNFSSNQKNNVSPSRKSWLSALSGKYEIPAFNITAKLLSVIADDDVQTGNTTAHYKHLSPYIGFSVKPVNALPVRLRAFYKNTFRMPTFGDMYYSTVTNVNLKPENARQYNLGLTLSTACGEIFPYLSVSGDAYLNRVRNKIVAIPTANMAFWSVRNYGKVDIQGLDLNTTAHIRTGSQFLWRINGVYTLQNALDKTDPKKETYNKRLIYATRHSASGYIGLQTPWIEFNYNILYSGKRYDSTVNTPESQMKPFAEQGISFVRTFNTDRKRFTVSVECLNLFDVQYEVVRSYPMPGRSFRFGIKFDY
jgi:outer membrane cobalamin receptor